MPYHNTEAYQMTGSTQHFQRTKHVKLPNNAQSPQQLGYKNNCGLHVALLFIFKPNFNIIS
jgi:hypothetical protein